MNRQTLTEALADESDGRWSWQLPTFVAAARLVERLLPGECRTCRDPEHVGPGESNCDGSGRVWDEGIVEAVARTFHESYERLAPSHDYETRIESRVEWPPPNADLMRATARAVLSALVELLTEKVSET